MPAGENIREIHVVCNTHWDREFRETFEITRRGLLEMLDLTLDVLEADPRYESFTLDAHVILLEDYLELRPQRRAQVERFLRQRRLLIGPWYTLPDSMNIGGEALVRNFLRAAQVAASFGTACMKVGYSPNNWGQPSQMPQIFRGFGIDSALIYRGISCHESPSEFIWDGPDGSWIYGHRFARLARYNWYYLVHRPATRGVAPTDKLHRLAGSAEVPFRVADGLSRATGNFALLAPHDGWDAETLKAALDGMLALEGPDSSTGLFLAMHGHDVSVAHPKDGDMVAAAADALRGRADVRFSNLEAFVERLRAEVDVERAVHLQGERRMNLKEGFWTYLLPCTISARTYLKVLNTRAENALTGEAEPLCALARTLGAEYPSRYLDRAWRFLLTNHTHDANAGCAPDRVCADMEFRYRQCLDIADICTEDALRHVARNLPGAPGDMRLLVCNPHAQPWSGVAAMEVALPAAADGAPGTAEAASASAAGADVGAVRGASGPAGGDSGQAVVDGLEILDSAGNSWPVQVTAARDDSLFVNNRWDVPTFANARRVTGYVQLRDVPAVGFRAYTVRLRKRAPSQRGRGDMLASGDSALENEHVRVEVRADGTVDLRHKPTGRIFRGLNAYRDQGEAGNAWQQEPPAQDEIVESAGGAAQVELIENGPLVATIRAIVTLRVPRDCPDGKRRSAERVPLQIATQYTLFRDDPRLHIQVDFDNTARDHWLRAVFPSDVRTDVVHADTHFDIVTRAIRHPDDTGWIERFRGTAPLHQMVDLSDDDGGLALLTAGLFEYEVLDDDRRTLLLSLVRSFPIKLQVSEEKVEILPDTGVQCPGPQSFRYAVLPHTGTHVDADVLTWAQRFNNPPRLAQVAPNGGKLPEEFGLLEVRGRGLIVSAIKQAEQGGDLVVRLFNSGAVPQEGALYFACEVAAVRRAALDETPGDALPAQKRVVRLIVGPKKIETMLVTLADGRQF